jgi:hypothetical protein
MLPSEFSVLLLLLSPSLHFDTSVALAWIIWLESWVHRWLIRTYVYSFHTAHLYVIWCSVTLSFAEIDPIDLYLICPVHYCLLQRLIQVIWIMPSFAHLRSMVLSYLSYWYEIGVFCIYFFSDFHKELLLEFWADEILWFRF